MIKVTGGYVRPPRIVVHNTTGHMDLQCYTEEPAVFTAVLAFYSRSKRRWMSSAIEGESAGD